MGGGQSKDPRRLEFESQTYKDGSFLVVEIDLNSQNWFDFKDFKKLSHAISREDCILKKFIFQNTSNIESQRYALAIGNALTVNKSITSIDLILNKIGGKGALAIGNALTVNTSITSINLCHNRIESKGALAISNALTINNTITNIDLGHNMIGDKGAFFIAKFIAFNNTLTIIKLNCNQIGDEGVSALANALIVNTSITSINLGGNRIQEAGAIAISKALTVNQLITVIFLGNNWIMDKGISALADALALNSSITDINLFRIHIGDEGALALAKSLTVNTSITKIQLFMNNQIGDEGLSALAKSLINNKSINIGINESVFDNFNSEQCLLNLGLSEEFKTKSNAEIISYLKEIAKEGTREVKSIRLMLVGGGFAGKTTLVKRLTDDTFIGDRKMTDGITMSKLIIDDVNFIVYDFAGQSEYIHTHSLFFDGEKSMFLAVYRRDSDKEAKKDFDSFLDMVYNCAPSAEIIFATTFADDKEYGRGPLSLNEIDEIKKRNFRSKITHVIPVDSKSGTGLKELKSILVREAAKFPNIKKKIPNSFDRLQDKLDMFVEQNIFSISAEEFYRIAVEEVKMSDRISVLAAELFCDWGILHRLSNDDLVLRPQKLANVLACVFTKEESKLSKLGDLREGLLKHDAVTLDLIWGKGGDDYDSRLWNVNDENNKGDDPPFLQLLHDSYLAYKLYNTDGKSISASLVSALLPDFPFGFDKTREVNEETLKDFFFLSNTKIDFNYYSSLYINFSTRIPIHFFSRLQVRLRYLQTLNGPWKNGSFLQISCQPSGDNILKTNASIEKRSNDSYAIVFCELEKSKITIISTASNNTALSIVLDEIVKLKNAQFDELLEWGTLIYNEVTWDKTAILNVLKFNGYLKLPHDLKDEIAVTKSIISVKSVSTKKSKMPPVVKLIPSCYSELSLLNDLLERYDCIVEKDEDGEEILFLLISIQQQFTKCAKEIADIMNFKKSEEGKKSKRKLNKFFIYTIWLPVCDGKNNIFLLPLTPKTNPFCCDEEWLLITESDVNIKIDKNQLKLDENNQAVSLLIEKCLNILDVKLESGWSLQPIGFVENSEDIVSKIVKFQTVNFVKLEEDYWIYLKYEQHARAMKPAPIVRDIDIQSKLDEILKLALENNKEIKETTSKVININSKIDEIAIEIKELREEFHKSFSVLTKIVTNLNKRNKPTTFILLDSNSIDKANTFIKGRKLSETSRLEYLKNGMDRMKVIFDSIGNFINNPGEQTKSLLMDKLHDKMYLYLMCESCLQPQEDGKIWPLAISKPKDIVPKILPLARAGVAAARGLNIGLQIGKCFGFPLPSIDDKKFTGVIDFVNSVGESTLTDYNHLQNLVKLHWGYDDYNNDNIYNNKSSNNQPLSASSSDFSIHEFETFLSQYDPTQTYSALLQCVYYKEEGDKVGDKVYICKQCYEKK